MTDTAQYAGDDYAVHLDGLEPFDEWNEFLPWNHVEDYWVFPNGKLQATRVAAFVHPPGTNLHEDAPLAKQVDDHFAAYGTSVGDVADNIEGLVRSADPFVVHYGSNWYEHEAGHAVRRLQRQGYPRSQAAHIIADLSPQNNWLGTPNHPELGNREEAVRYGREVKHMLNGAGKYEDGILEVTDDMADRAHDLYRDRNGNSTSTLQPGRYDISHKDPSQWDIGPKEMAELPQFHSRAGRSTRANGIAAALGLRHDEHLGPKTGPFKHNIEYPHDSPLATIDTHMVDAGGIQVPQNQKSKFLASVGGLPKGRQRVGIYRGYGQAGMASALHEVVRRMKSRPERWQSDAAPIAVPHVQGVAWVNHLYNKKPSFRKVLDPLREMPPEAAFGYNFGHPGAY